MRQKESQKDGEFLSAYTRPYTPNRLEGMESCIKFFIILLRYRSIHFDLLPSGPRAPEERASSVCWWWENKKLSTLTLNRFRNIDSVLGKFHIFYRFRSKPFLDPQSSIFSRFWRAGALSRPQTLYSSVIEGQEQSETDKNRLTWVNRVRRPR